MIDYKEQIKSPLWQKKRLEILSRDKFACVVCGSTDKQLHVHHKRYIAGRNYWDYPDELLVTLCEDCHRKAHNRSIPKFASRQKPMKTIFYTDLFKEARLPEPNDRIIYSYLVYKSFANADQVFHGDRFDDEAFSDYLQNNTSGIIRKFSIPKTVTDTGLSYNTVNARLIFLSQQGIITIYENNNIEVEYIFDIAKSTYFELIDIHCLKGMNRIVYSYFVFVSKDKGSITMDDKNQSRILNISRKYYQKILYELKAKGLIMRLENGNIKVN